MNGFHEWIQQIINQIYSSQFKTWRMEPEVELPPGRNLFGKRELSLSELFLAPQWGSFVSCLHMSNTSYLSNFPVTVPSFQNFIILQDGSIVGGGLLVQSWTVVS